MPACCSNVGGAWHETLDRRFGCHQRDVNVYHRRSHGRAGRFQGEEVNEKVSDRDRARRYSGGDRCLRDRPRGHALVDLRRRGGRRRRAGQGVRGADRTQVGRWRHRRFGRNGTADHDLAHYGRRSDGCDAVQPRSPGRGAGRGGPDAGPDRARREGGLEGHRQAREPARCLHAGRADLLRPGQHPLGAVALALEQGVRGGGARGSQGLERVRRGGAEAARGRHPAARPRRAALAGEPRIRHDPDQRRRAGAS